MFFIIIYHSAELLVGIEKSNLQNTSSLVNCDSSSNRLVCTAQRNQRRSFCPSKPMVSFTIESITLLWNPEIGDWNTANVVCWFGESGNGQHYSSDHSLRYLGFLSSAWIREKNSIDFEGVNEVDWQWCCDHLMEWEWIEKWSQLLGQFYCRLNQRKLRFVASNTFTYYSISSKNRVLMRIQWNVETVSISK